MTIRSAEVEIQNADARSCELPTPANQTHPSHEIRVRWLIHHAIAVVSIVNFGWQAFGSGFPLQATAIVVRTFRKPVILPVVRVSFGSAGARVARCDPVTLC